MSTMTSDRSIRATLADPWTRLGLLGTLLALSVLFVHVPTSLWAGNLAEFHSALAAFTLAGLAAIIVGLAIVLLLFHLLPRVMRIGLAPLLCAIGVVWWVYAYFMVSRMTVLNGQDAPLDFKTALGPWETTIVAGICVLLAIAIGMMRRLATSIFVMFNIGLFAASLGTAAMSGRNPLRGVATDTSAVFQFSPRANVLVLLLDGLQSDVADEVFRTDPALAKAFDGFELYKDTMGVAPTTFLSLPTIHSGRVFDGTGSIPQFFSDSIARQSFVTRFADAGYHTTMIEPVADICPDRTAACASARELVRTRRERLVQEGVRLLDLALFRISPVNVKERLYNEGQWLFASMMNGSYEVNRIFEGMQVLREIEKKASLDAKQPTMKFFHVFTTHAPYVLQDDCRTVAAVHAFDHLVSQAHCGLKSVASLLQHLQRNELYDQTVILVLADHGIGRETHYDQHRQFDSAEWASLAGAANPTFLLKRLNRRGALHEMPGEVALADVGATLCAASGACTTPSGFAAGTAPADRPRLFNQYEWKHEFWSTLEIPNITRYSVRGPVWDRESWRPDVPIAPYRLGDPIALNEADKSDRYLQSGWGAAEPWGRWTAGRVAQMALRVTPPATGTLAIVARAWAFVPPNVDKQEATWVVNGQPIATWTFTASNTPAAQRLVIPREVIGNQEELMLDIRIGHPIAPAELGSSSDARRLGLALAELKIVSTLDGATDTGAAEAARAAPERIVN